MSDHQENIDLLRTYLEELRESGGDYLVTLPRGLGAAQPDVVAETVIPYVDTKPIKESLNAIRADLGDCHRCALGNGRTSLVFGVGNPQARLVFVGEAPGKYEDLQGEPFVGAAGQLLTNIIQAMGFRREEVYICNLLKCRPPQNRDPLPAEIDVCSPFLLRQIQAIGPVVLVALGKFAAQVLLQSSVSISRLRGQFYDYHGIPLMPTFHPSAVLRDAALKRPVWEDMQQVMHKLGLKTPGKSS